MSLALPGGVLLPLVLVLRELLVRGVHLLLHVGQRAPGGLQAALGRVRGGKLLAQLLHQLEPLLAHTLWALVPEEALWTYTHAHTDRHTPSNANGLHDI